MENRFLVVGIATGSNDVEVWWFEEEDLRIKFCEQMVRTTGYTYHIIQGVHIGSFKPEERPVKYTPENKD